MTCPTQEYNYSHHWECQYCYGHPGCTCYGNPNIICDALRCIAVDGSYRTPDGSIVTQNTIQHECMTFKSQGKNIPVSLRMYRT